MSRRPPRWLLRETVLAVHERVLAEHGGEAGVRDVGILSSALDRPRNRLHYGGDVDHFTLAAAYAFGLIGNHPFVDGNKRAGFMAAYVFLADNGWALDAPEAEAVLMTLGLADGSIAEGQYADWLRQHGRRA